MINNLYSTKFAIFIFYFFSTFFSGTTSQTQLSQEEISPKSAIFKLTQTNQLFSFPLEKEGMSSIQLCNLEKEKNYKISLEESEESCDDEIYFLETPNEITRHFQISGIEDCYEILIQKNCDLEKEVTLSIQAFSNKKKEATLVIQK